MKHRYIDVMHRYMQALHAADYDAIVAMFAPGGKVLSPFLGEMEAGPFFARLGGASKQNVITPIDVFASAAETMRATCYFRYDWTVNDGTLISFDVMDLFEFEPGSDRVQKLTLIYDTHPIRSTAGNKYDIASAAD